MLLDDTAEAKRLAIINRISSRHSKSFWSEDLSQKSAELRALRKNSSAAPTTRVEKDFKMRKMSLRAFYLRNRWRNRETLTTLSYKKQMDFWQHFRHVFQMRERAIGPLQTSDGRLYTSKEGTSEELRKTFFLGQHLKVRSFDEDLYVEVTRRVRNQDPQINAEHDEEQFHEDISMYE